MCVPPTEIVKGGVKLMRNRNLSYAPQVNWRDIVREETAPIEIEDNGPTSEFSGLWTVPKKRDTFKKSHSSESFSSSIISTDNLT